MRGLKYVVNLLGIYNFIMNACYNAYDTFVEYFQMQQRCPQRCRLFSDAGKHHKMMSITNMIIHVFVNESGGEKTKISTTYSRIYFKEKKLRYQRLQKKQSWDTINLVLLPSRNMLSTILGQAVTNGVNNR